jgi:hypothetical protein
VQRLRRRHSLSICAEVQALASVEPGYIFVTCS